MSLQDNLFTEEIENDVTLFSQRKEAKRVLIFPPVNNYRRFLIHQIVQDNFSDLLSTFSIGQGSARRTVVCYKSDVIRDQKLNGVVSPRGSDSSSKMGVEDRRSPSASPDNSRQRQVKSTPAVEIYRPPAARRAQNGTSPSVSTTPESTTLKARQKRPDRAVYVPKHRRSAEAEGSHQLQEEVIPPKPKNERRSIKNPNVELPPRPPELPMNNHEEFSTEKIRHLEQDKFRDENHGYFEPEVASDTSNIDVKLKTIPEVKNNDKLINNSEETSLTRNLVPDVLIISGSESSPSRKIIQADVATVRPPEKKLKKMARAKSKPASPPSPPVKVNRDECDWDSLFDDNGECLDPTLIEELTAAVGEVTIEQPKNDYKAFSRPVEVSSDEFAHVVEIYNFPSDFKTSDLAAVFSTFKNGGFELRWVDDTHCLGVFSSPLVAAEVLASDHPFVKTRPLSEATALSRTKARKSAEFMQPYRSRPETCAALARRLVTGALGVRLATARQEREHEKVVLREAKEKRRLAKKQCDDAWEGIITPK
ncbi:R3H and coiled-coil domain-containing protein 1 isoform X2 [Fopius arisanus]|uniref:R3H and coiled-coil domain-containing protein 1 isoform X2 n=1 Tax=Fopius arisanus TaxID=64838 RepID=A0A9R1TXY3_9HYME|nr:PREDICTED: R3H and coiled-coil domain-containing protein 1 isoform X2 [Fopius arisanus]